MEFFKSLFGNGNSGKLRKFESVVLKINQLEGDVEKLSSEDLRERTEKFKTRLGEGEPLDGILGEAFACVREAAKRTLKQRHYDVQLLGGIVLHYGNIAEMKTGEGKTLVATLPAYLNALSGKGVHSVTVNDYLARRDAVWMGQIYHALGMSVGVLNNDASYIYNPLHVKNDDHGNDNKGTLDTLRDTEGSFHVVHEFLKPCTKKEAYAADITYGTNNEFGFDYLRDNVSYSKDNTSQRDFHYAIVDEIDSILIDEARTPLIISAPSQEPEGLYYTFAKIAGALEKEKDFTIDEKMRAIELSDEGITKAEKMLGIENIYTEHGVKYVHHLENAVRAKALFHKDKEYVVKDGAIIIVDEFTGRLQPGRRWSEGLHQAIEAKEGLKVERESRTIASITFQNYFRMYEKLSGMTGTASTSAEEFLRVYNLDVISVPTNRPMIRADHNDLIFQTEKGKFESVARRVKELHQKGQPVLVGTVSIEKNEVLSAYLKREGVPHEVLNAKNHEREGEIIAQAGRLGNVTIATNMAGRGVDIVLGGNPLKPEDAEKVCSLGGLLVIGTERHEARRIDNQLRGRAGRQGDPGETQFFVSLEDTLMRVFARDTIKALMGRFGIPEDQPIENSLITRSLESAQTKIEGFNFDARRHVLAYDDVLNQQRRSIYELRRGLLVGERGAAEDFLKKLSETYPDAKENITKKKEELGEEKFFEITEKILLQAVDIHWMEHLEAMEYLRSSVNLRAYGQRDPLVEYKKEGLHLYKEMKLSLNQHVIDILSGLKENTASKTESSKPLVVKNISRASRDEKVGRNDPCPCGAINPSTGKPYKYKQCGLVNASHHRR